MATTSLRSDQASRWLTDARFAPYLRICGGNHERAVALYVWNAQVSAVMMETLHHVEVLLRNAIDAQFTPVDGSARPRDSWLEDTTILNSASRDRVRETIGRISRRTDAHSRPPRWAILAREVQPSRRRAADLTLAPRPIDVAHEAKIRRCSLSACWPPPRSVLG